MDGNFLGVQLPSATGGGVALSYAITPPIASGVNVNFETLRLFGVADANADLGNTRHTLRVTDVNGASASLQFDLQVYDRFGFAAGVNPSAATYTVGAAGKPVTFLAARGGRGPYDYSIAIEQIDAPNNLTFDASARELSGMFLGATEPVSIAYRATDANGAMVQHLVELAVIEAPLFSPADLTELSRGYSFRVNVAAQVTLPEVDLGAAPFTYRLTDGADSGYEAAQFALSGLNFDAAARILSGAPTQAYGGAVEYHARDSKASYTSATTDIRAFGALSLSQSDISLAVGKNEMVALNAALNVVGAASYTLTDLVGDDLTNLPGGIAFNPSTRTLSGVAPNSPVDPLTFVYTVHDDYDSSSASASFAISVDAKPSFNPLQIFATYTVNNAAYSSGGARAPGNLTLPRANVGPTLSYALEGAIPDGMTRTRIADDELVLTGLPTRAAAFTFRRIAIDVDNPQQRGTFTLISVVAPTPTFGAQTVDKLHATIGGNEIDETMPMASGGAGALVYSIVRAVPSGLTFDVDTRELTGVAAADAVTGNVARAYNAVDINGVGASLLFDMQVYAALRFVESIQPQAVTYSLATDKTLTFSAVAGGRAPIQYALEVAAIGASNDLTFDATTRLLSGGYLGGSAAVDLTYIATDANGARREHPFSVAAVDAPQFDPVDIAALVVGYTFRVGATIDATLPSAVDGVTPLTHRLTRGVDSDYDAAQFAGGGVAFDSATRILSGAATIAFNDAVEYHVRDANGAGASTPATIRILSSLTLEQPDVNLSGAAGVNVQLARVRNAVGAIVYTLTDLDGVGLDDLPSGVTFDAVAQRLGGIAPGAAITQSFIYTATDDFDANSVSVTFAVSVVDKPTFSPTSLSVTYTANNATYVRNDALISDSLTLPMADGAVGQLSYAVIESNLPNGVSQTALANDTVVISGAPSETGAFTFARIAADSGGVEPGTFTLLMEVTAAMLDPIANGQSGLPALYHATIAGPDLDADLGTWRCQIGCYYEMSVQLPPGLVHWSDAATGENRLRGSPTAGAGVGNYGVRGGDLWGESIFPFTLQVYPQLTFAPGNPSAAFYSVGAQNAQTFTLAGGGRAPLQYAFDVSGLTFDNNLAFDFNTRILSGTFAEAPSADDAGQLTYSVTDANGATAQHRITLYAINAPSFTDADITALGGGYSFRVGSTVDATLPLASSASSSVTYRITLGADGGYDAAQFSVAGLAFNSSTAVFSGSPAEVFSGAVQYHARDAYGGVGSAASAIHIFAVFGLTQDDINVASGVSVDLPLSDAVNAIGAVAYTLTDLDGVGLDDLPSGVNYDATNRKLTGTAPGSAVTAQSFIYTATDGFDSESVSVTFTIGVVEKPVFTPSAIQLTYTVNGATYSRDGARSGDAVTLPPASGGGASGVTYSLPRADLPSGLTRADLPNAAIVISGAPTAVGAFTFIRIATDTLFATRSGTFTLITEVAQRPSYAGLSQAVVHATVQGNALSVQLPQPNGGAGALVYSVSPPLPNGLQLDAATAQLSGTVAGGATVGDTLYTVTATDLNGISDTLAFTLRLYAPLGFGAANPPTVAYSVGAVNAYTFAAGANGRAPYQYALPLNTITFANNLAFDANARVLSGMFSEAGDSESAGALTYVVTDANGAAVEYAFSLSSFTAPNFAAPDITTLDNGYSFRIGAAIDVTLPLAQGLATPFTHRLTLGADSGYDATPFAVGGVAFDAVTRILSGTPSATFGGEVEYHVRDAYGGAGSASTEINIFAALTLAQQNIDLAAGVAIDLPLDTAVNAIGAATYTLTDVDGIGLDNLPSGINYDSTNRKLTGTAPATTQAVQTFIYGVTDDFDDSSVAVTFTLEVVERPVFSPSQIAATYTQNATPYSSGGVRYDDSLTLPPAGGGGVSGVSYAIVGGEAAMSNYGFTRTLLSDNSMVISGAPIAIGAFTFERVAVDLGNPARQGSFTLIVTIAPRAGFGAQSQSQLHATIEGNALDVQLPTASGGAGGVQSYAMDMPLPSGLQLDSSTARLSGTAAADASVGKARPTIRAEDLNAVGDSLAFDLSVYAKLIFAATPPSAITYSVGVDKSRALAAGAGGRTPYTYALDTGGVGVANTLTFDANTRTLSGAFSAPGAAMATYTITDANGAGVMHELALRSTAAPTFAAAAVTTLDNGYSFRVGAAIDATLPAAQDGVAPITYRLTVGAGSSYSSAQLAVGGVAFDSATGVLSGAPTAAFAGAVEYHARDANGAISSRSVNLNLLAALSLVQPDIEWGSGEGVDQPLASAQNAIGAVAYRLTDLDGSVNLAGLPNGVTYASTTRRFGGVLPQNAPSSTASFIYFATDGHDDSSVTLTFTISVFEKPAFNPSTLEAIYTVNTPTFGVGGVRSAGDLTLPAASGISNLVYSPLPSLPNGLSRRALSDGAIVISGAPSGIANYTYTRVATDTQNRAGTFTLRIRVVQALAFSPQALEIINGIGNNIIPLRFATDNSYTLPEASFGASPISYNTNNSATDFARASGSEFPSFSTMSFDATTRVIAGRITGSQVLSRRLYYHARDAQGAVVSSGKMGFVGQQPLTLPAQDDLVVPIKSTPNIEFAEAENKLADVSATSAYGIGEEVVTYSLTALGGGALPGSLRLNNARTLVGAAPPNAAAPAMFVYTATDADGDSDSTTFTMEFADTPRFIGGVPGNRTFTAAHADALTLPLAQIDGSGVINYALSGEDRASAWLTKTPTSASTTQQIILNINTNAGQSAVVLTYTAANLGSVTTAIFNVSVADALTFARVDITKIEDGAVGFYRSPTNLLAFAALTFNGGVAPYVYALNPVPSGLTLTGAALEGTYDRVTLGAAAATTFRITDANGAQLQKPFDWLVYSNAARLNGVAAPIGVYSRDAAIVPPITMPTLAQPETLWPPIAHTVRLSVRGVVAELAVDETAFGLTLSQIGATETYTLSGAPDTGGVYQAVYRVQPNRSGAASHSFSFTVIAPPSYAAAQDDLTFTAAHPRTVNLLDAIDGAGTVAYTLTRENGSALPSGLLYDAGTRQLRSTTALAAADLGNFIQTATDDNGAFAAVTFAVLAVAFPNFAANDVTTLGNGYSFRAGVAIDVTLPSAAGGLTPLTYRMTLGATSDYFDSPLRIDGVDFDTATRVLSGVGVAASTAQFRYHARDGNDATASTPSSMNIFGALTLEQGDVSLPTDVNNYTFDLTDAENVVGTAAYTLTDLDGGGLDDLPSGITYDATLRQLGGNVPSTAAAPKTFIYTITDDYDAGVVAVTFTIGVVDRPVFTPAQIDVTYTVNVATYSRDGANAVGQYTLPAATGGSTATPRYNIAQGQNDLQAIGLRRGGGTLDDTLTIDGTPTATGDVTFIRVATDKTFPDRKGTFTLIVTVAPQPSFADKSQSPIQAIAGGAAINAPLPTADGGAGDLAYSLAPALPSSLQFDGDSILLSGAVDAGTSASTAQYVLTATDVSTARPRN